MARTLTSSDARRYYERFAHSQDRQGWYEDAALSWLIEQGRFERATSVLEVGCGTGRFAARLINQYLPKSARYLGLDISWSMLAIAQDRLHGKASGVDLVQGDVTITLPIRDARFDRFIAAYVFDLLSDEEAHALFEEAHRVLAPGGLACLSSLGITGSSGLSRTISKLWRAVQRVAPRCVGGCRPIDLPSKLGPAKWSIVNRTSVQPWRVATDIVIARRL